MSEEPGRPDERDRPQPPDPGSTQPVDLGHTRPLPPARPVGPSRRRRASPTRRRPADRSPPSPSRPPATTGTGRTRRRPRPVRPSAPQASAAHAAAPGRPPPLGAPGSAARGPATLVAAVIGGALAVALIAGLFGGLAGALVDEPVGLRWVGPAARAGARVDRPRQGLDRRHRGQGAAQRGDDQGQGRRRRPAPAPASSSSPTATSSPTTTSSPAPPQGGDDHRRVLQRHDRADATIVGRDASYDLAVIKVGRTRPARRCRSAPPSDVVVGDQVIAIGAPLGLEQHRHQRHRQRPQPAGDPGWRRRPTSRSSTRSRPTPPSTPATPAARCSTCRAASSASTPPSPRIPGSGSDNAVGQHRRRLRDPERPGPQDGRPADLQTGKASHPVIGVILDPPTTGDGVRIRHGRARWQRPCDPGRPGRQGRAQGRRRHPRVRRPDRSTSADDLVVGHPRQVVGDTRRAEGASRREPDDHCQDDPASGDRPIAAEAEAEGGTWRCSTSTAGSSSLLAVLAVVVLGPERLPEYAAKLGRLDPPGPGHGRGRQGPAARADGAGVRRHRLAAVRPAAVRPAPDRPRGAARDDRRRGRTAVAADLRGPACDATRPRPTPYDLDAT